MKHEKKVQINGDSTRKTNIGISNISIKYEPKHWDHACAKVSDILISDK